MESQNFWINIYKPRGVNSTKVTNIVKKLFKPSKVGHAGTLDPLAEGLLPIAVGEATKTIEFFHEVTKTYQFEVIFGKKSTTGDLEGEVVEATEKIPTKDEILNVLNNFKGKIEQTPPKYSAIKIDGKRAYDLARAGEDFEMKKREVTIYNLELLSLKFDKAMFEAEVSLGTYIRTLAEDIAEAAGSLCIVSILKRTKYGCFNLGNAFELDENIIDNSTSRHNLNSGYNNKDSLNNNLQTLKKSIKEASSLVDVVLDDIPVLHLDLELVSRLRQGQRLRHMAEQGVYRIYDPTIGSNKNKPLSLIAKQDDPSQGEVLRPYKVFNL